MWLSLWYINSMLLEPSTGTCPLAPLNNSPHMPFMRRECADEVDTCLILGAASRCQPSGLKSTSQMRNLRKHLPTPSSRYTVTYRVLGYLPRCMAAKAQQATKMIVIGAVTTQNTQKSGDTIFSPGPGWKLKKDVLNTAFDYI